MDLKQHLLAFRDRLRGEEPVSDPSAMAEQQILDSANPAQPIMPQHSATTKAENIESNGALTEGGEIVEPLSPRKRGKPFNEENEPPTPSKRQKGVAPIKAE
jgi:tRNA-dihydrouridine synthase 3